jgi:pentatricopeptide repeat protein
MDEVLLSSVVEACVRIGKPDLLAKRLEILQDNDRIAANGSHTYGSLIKAYGHSQDLEGVWRCWKDMRNRLIKPTSITLGCMIEAVVNNGDTEGAFELIHQMQQDEQCKDVVNSIMYCSILKGFAREKKLERVCDTYAEMCEKRIEMSLITFNTLIDACARAGRMDNLPKFLEDMKKHHVDPNIVTYSTIIKGYCQSGDIQRGFAILKEMKHDTSLKPDEIMYNSLLDGCAQNNLFDEGQELLAEMEKEGVTPSNFTLSIMVKLWNRARKPDEAFKIVADMTKKYKFKPNVHVYTNLLQTCIRSRQHSRALTVLSDMIKNRVQPDGRVYSTLIRASIYEYNYEQAASLLRASLGLPGALELPDVKLPACFAVDHGSVNETLSSLVDGGVGQSLAAPLLADIKKFNIKAKIDQATQRRVAMAHADEPVPSSHSNKGKGKGKGGGRCNW